MQKYMTRNTCAYKPKIYNIDTNQVSDTILGWIKFRFKLFETRARLNGWQNHFPIITVLRITSQNNVSKMVQLKLYYNIYYLWIPIRFMFGYWKKLSSQIFLKLYIRSWSGNLLFFYISCCYVSYCYNSLCLEL